MAEDDIAIDNAILAQLNDISQQLNVLVSQQQGNKLQILGQLDASLKNLDGRIVALNSMLGQQKDYTVDVSIDGADGAIQDLVSRVLEEVIIRIKQENLLTVADG